MPDIKIKVGVYPEDSNLKHDLSILCSMIKRCLIRRDFGPSYSGQWIEQKKFRGLLKKGAPSFLPLFNQIPPLALSILARTCDPGSSLNIGPIS